MFREANFCADALVRMGSAVPDFNSRFVSPPPCVIPLLMADSMGMYRLRICNATPDVFGSKFLIKFVAYQKKKVSVTQMPKARNSQNRTVRIRPAVPALGKS